MPAGPLISVLITAFNRERYIADAIESVLASTFSNFEIIVLDDCSTDRTVSIAKSFEAKDNRVKVFVNQKNLGQFPNRNKAAGLSACNYIKYLDSDDLMYPHCLEIYSDAIKHFPNASVYGECRFPSFSGKLPVQFVPNDSYINHYLKGSQLLRLGPSGCLFNKQKFFESRCFNIELGILTDTHLMLTMAAVSPIVGVARDTIYWRRHEGQVTEDQKDYVRMLKERYQIDMLILNDGNCPLKKTELSFAVLLVKKRFGRNLLRTFFLHHNFKGVGELMRSCNFTFWDIFKSIFPNKKYLRHHLLL